MQKLLREDDTFADRLERARSLLKRRRGPDPAWPALLAACLFAVCALGCAVGAMTGPPFKLDADPGRPARVS